MKRILIADSSKASLVMTSEVFKDLYPGIQVLVARTSGDAIQLAKNHADIDAFIIDFDLPDLNGAQTALLLKKISQIPILITSFDREDAVKSIETLLVKYEDCKSWLKKPINPEVVIAVAQRYCDGKIRAQKRIICQVPALTTIEIQSKINVSVKKTKVSKAKEQEVEKISKVKALESEKTTLSFHGIIEDCSLNGVKLRPSKNTNNGSIEWSTLLEKIEHIATGSSVCLKIPISDDIEFGTIAEPSKIKTTKSVKEIKHGAVAKTKSSPKKPELQNEDDSRMQLLNGKIIWTSAESGEWYIGIEFEDQGLSKRLFEAIIALQSRQHKGFQTQSIMKTNRSA